MDQGRTTVRIDVWLWSVRLFRTRADATAACRGGKVERNGRPAKAASALALGDSVVAATPGGQRVVEVTRLIDKRVGAAVAAGCLVDHTPPRPPSEVRTSDPARRDRGSGRPTKRDRRRLDRLRGR